MRFFERFKGKKRDVKGFECTYPQLANFLGCLVPMMEDGPHWKTEHQVIDDDLDPDIDWQVVGEARRLLAQEQIPWREIRFKVDLVLKSQQETREYLTDLVDSLEKRLRLLPSEPSVETQSGSQYD